MKHYGTIVKARDQQDCLGVSLSSISCYIYGPTEAHTKDENNSIIYFLRFMKVEFLKAR